MHNVKKKKKSNLIYKIANFKYDIVDNLQHIQIMIVELIFNRFLLVNGLNGWKLELLIGLFLIKPCIHGPVNSLGQHELVIVFVDHQPVNSWIL